MRCYQPNICNFEEKFDLEVITCGQFHFLDLVPNNVYPIMDLVFFCGVLSPGLHPPAAVLR